MMRLLFLATLFPALAELADDDSAAAADGHSWSLGESLDDDDDSAPAGGGGGDFEDPGPDVHPDEMLFGSEGDAEKTLTQDIVFDQNGNVQDGGAPEVNYWKVVEFNGRRYSDPVEASNLLKSAIENSQSYMVKFAPPVLEGFKCTEKVEKLDVVLDREYHDMSEELIGRALTTLSQEHGIVNTKQLNDLAEKDFDEIKIPALIKSRLRKVKAEVADMFHAAELAAKGIDMDSAEVLNELKEFKEARGGGGGTEKKEEVKKPEASTAAGDVAEEEEEDGTFKSLVWAVMNCPTCKGKETIACFRTCRYGGALEEGGDKKEKRSWGECLDKCIENRWLRATFSAMLPRN